MTRISVVLIVKNEEALLHRCLASVREADEIIVVDTGSTDRTVEIARQWTEKVFTDYTWADDFADARNHARAKATSDWILSIDADEYLSCPFARVREAAELGFMAVNVKMVSEPGKAQQQFWFPKLFKNCEQVFWAGAVHNHLSVLGEDISIPVEITFGFSPAHSGDPQRTLRILEKWVATHPDCVRERFYLGREYTYRGMYEKALPTLGRYVQQSNFPGEKAEAFLVMAQTYLKMGQWSDARDACVQAIILNANFKEAILFMALLSGDGQDNPRFQANADQWKKMAETANNEGVLFVRGDSAYVKR